MSSIVNHLVGTEKPTPFDFLSSGTLLRTTLDEHLTANGLSSESTLTLECVRSLIPPLYLASFEHDDWVSSVDVLSDTSPARTWTKNGSLIGPGQERILSGSYDGLLRVWNMSSEVLATSASANAGGHTSSILAAKFISPNRIASAGSDRTVRIWKYTDSSESSSANIEPYLELHGHRVSVNGLAVHGPSNRVLSASTDNTIGVWSCKKSDAPAIPPSHTSSGPSARSKKRRLAASVNTPQRGPLSFLTGHTAPVSATIFSPTDNTVAYSTSWDHTLRTWDLTVQSSVDIRTTSHPLLSLTALPTFKLLAAGTSARHITLIDPRASAATVSPLTLRGHTNAVIALAPDPASPWGLVSASHDGTCRVWDVRATKSGEGGPVGESLYTISRESAKGEERRRVGGEGVKVFGVVWDATVGIVSAGEDKRVQLNRGQEATKLDGGALS